MQAALMSWWLADMDLSKLPPMSEPGWVDAITDYVGQSVKKAYELETARHGKNAAPVSAIATGRILGVALTAIHELAKQVYALQRATDAVTAAGNDGAMTLADAVKDLQERVQGIEGKGLAYAGTWSRNVTYQHGDIAAHGGALWVASATTTDMPGASAAWQRMLKADLRGQFTAGE